MENRGTKLDVIFSIPFLSDFCERTEQARKLKDDDLLNRYFELKKVLFRFSDQRRVLVNDGQEVSEEMFKKAYADLLMTPSLRQLGMSKSDDINVASVSSNAALLLNASDDKIDQVRRELGILATNPDRLIGDVTSVTLNWKWNEPIQIHKRSEQDKRIDFDASFGKYRMPANQFVLFDPFLFTWPVSILKTNIVGLIRALINCTTKEDQRPLQITIITTYQDNYKTDSKKSAPTVVERKAMINTMYAELLKSLIGSLRFELILMCVDLAELKLKVKMDKTNGNADEGSVRRKEFQSFCKREIHDRWFFTNYYCSDSGRGYQLSPNFQTRMTLFSQFQDEHLIVRNTHEQLVAALFNYSRKEALRDFFYMAP